MRGQPTLRFEASQPHVHAGELHLRNIDLTVGAQLAEALGRLELEGVYLGYAHLRLPAPEEALLLRKPAGVSQCEAVFTADRDVALTSLGRLSQLAREPGERVALSLSATLHNVGTSSIEWYEAIQPDGTAENVGEHPYLALHLYRLSGGRLKQIGRADVKHAFYATNSPPCVDCDSPCRSCPGGHVIYSDCLDVYPSSTNANRLYLGPRAEITLSTGAWTRLGSHFDGQPVNDFRNHGGSNDHDAFEHRLIAQDADLQAVGEFYVEGWYIVRDDVDLFNSMGNYPVTPQLGDLGWTFGEPQPLAQGSILDRLVAATVDTSTVREGLLDTGEGRLQLVAVTTDLGDGRYHHEYALMNFDFDRQVGALEIVPAPGAIVDNLEFVDVDGNPGNDWAATSTDETLRWSAPAGNAQDWGTLYSFAFDSDDAAAETRVTVFAVESGAPASYDIETAAVGSDADDSGGSSRFAVGPALAALLLVLLLAYRRRWPTR